MPTVSNTSPLIWLSKVGKLGLLKDLYGEILISEETYREAVEAGIKGGFKDAFTIKDACEQGWIKVALSTQAQRSACDKIIQQSSELHLGEVHALVLAKELGKDVLLLMDDSSGRAFAEAWGLKVRGVLYVVFSAVRGGSLGSDEAKVAVLELVRMGFRIDPKLLARVLSGFDM